MRATVGACALAGALLGSATLAKDAVPVSQVTIGGPFAYVVKRGDVVAGLSARYGVDPVVIARENGLTPTARLSPGQSLVLDNRHIVPAAPGATIVINIPQRMLFHVEAETAPVGYPIAVGRRDWPTPMGLFEIVAKEEHPTWDVPPSIQEEMRRSGQRVRTQVPPGPSNPLGDYWFGLSLPGIGIHGTPAFTSIYRPITHGCIRLHPEDIAELFPKVAVGTTGLIVYEPVLVALVEGTLFLEVHPDIYERADKNALTALRRRLEAGAFAGGVDWTAAREVLDRRDGIARAIGSSAGSTQQAQ